MTPISLEDFQTTGGRRARSGEQDDVGKLCIKCTVGSTARNQGAKYPLRPVQTSGEGRGGRTRSRGRRGEVPQRGAAQQSAVLSRGTRLDPASPTPRGAHRSRDHTTQSSPPLIAAVAARLADQPPAAGRGARALSAPPPRPECPRRRGSSPPARPGGR